MQVDSIQVNVSFGRTPEGQGTGKREALGREKEPERVEPREVEPPTRRGVPPTSDGTFLLPPSLVVGHPSPFRPLSFCWWSPLPLGGLSSALHFSRWWPLPSLFLPRKGRISQRVPLYFGPFLCYAYFFQPLGTFAFPFYLFRCLLVFS